MTAEGNGPLLCPSSRCVAGARLLGIVQHDGTVAFTVDDIRIDSGFVNAARRGRAPESRFRFAGPCQRGGCVQWTGARCGVVDMVVQHIDAAGVPTAAALPECAIRPSCRWYAQSGEQACLACPLVVTESGNASP